jgi:hypothetical protein
LQLQTSENNKNSYSPRSQKPSQTSSCFLVYENQTETLPSMSQLCDVTVPTHRTEPGTCTGHSEATCFFSHKPTTEAHACTACSRRHKNRKRAARHPRSASRRSLPNGDMSSGSCSTSGVLSAHQMTGPEGRVPIFTCWGDDNISWLCVEGWESGGGRGPAYTSRLRPLRSSYCIKSGRDLSTLHAGG